MLYLTYTLQVDSFSLLWFVSVREAGIANFNINIKNVFDILISQVCIFQLSFSCCAQFWPPHVILTLERKKRVTFGSYFAVNAVQMVRIITIYILRGE